MSSSKAGKRRQQHNELMFRERAPNVTIEVAEENITSIMEHLEKQPFDDRITAPIASTVSRVNEALDAFVTKLLAACTDNNASDAATKVSQLTALLPNLKEEAVKQVGIFLDDSITVTRFNVLEHKKEILEKLLTSRESLALQRHSFEISTRHATEESIRIVRKQLEDKMELELGIKDERISEILYENRILNKKMSLMAEENKQRIDELIAEHAAKTKALAKTKKGSKRPGTNTARRQSSAVAAGSSFSKPSTPDEGQNSSFPAAAFPASPTTVQGNNMQLAAASVSASFSNPNSSSKPSSPVNLEADIAVVLSPAASPAVTPALPSTPTTPVVPVQKQRQQLAPLPTKDSSPALKPSSVPSLGRNASIDTIQEEEEYDEVVVAAGFESLFDEGSGMIEEDDEEEEEEEEKVEKGRKPGKKSQKSPARKCKHCEEYLKEIEALKQKLPLQDFGASSHHGTSMHHPHKLGSPHGSGASSHHSSSHASPGKKDHSHHHPPSPHGHHAPQVSSNSGRSSLRNTASSHGTRSHHDDKEHSHAHRHKHSHKKKSDSKELSATSTDQSDEELPEEEVVNPDVEFMKLFSVEAPGIEANVTEISNDAVTLLPIETAVESSESQTKYSEPPVVDATAVVPVEAKPPLPVEEPLIVEVQTAVADEPSEPPEAIIESPEVVKEPEVVVIVTPPLQELDNVIGEDVVKSIPATGQSSPVELSVVDSKDTLIDMEPSMRSSVIEAKLDMPSVETGPNTLMTPLDIQPPVLKPIAMRPQPAPTTYEETNATALDRTSIERVDSEMAPYGENEWRRHSPQLEHYKASTPTEKLGPISSPMPTYDMEAGQTDLSIITDNQVTLMTDDLLFSPVPGGAVSQLIQEKLNTIDATQIKTLKNQGKVIMQLLEESLQSQNELQEILVSRNVQNEKLTVEIESNKARQASKEKLHKLQMKERAYLIRELAEEVNSLQEQIAHDKNVTDRLKLTSSNSVRALSPVKTTKKDLQPVGGAMLELDVASNTPGKFKTSASMSNISYRGNGGTNNQIPLAQSYSASLLAMEERPSMFEASGGVFGAADTRTLQQKAKDAQLKQKSKFKNAFQKSVAEQAAKNEAENSTLLPELTPPSQAQQRKSQLRSIRENIAQLIEEELAPKREHLMAVREAADRKLKSRKLFVVKAVRGRVVDAKDKDAKGVESVSSPATKIEGDPVTVAGK